MQRKMTKKQVIKHMKSIILKVLLILSIVLVLVSGIMADAFEMDNHLTRTLVVGGFTSFSLFMFLFFVCKFAFIEKRKIKKSIKYKYKIKSIDKFLKMLSNNLKNDAVYFVKKEIIDGNEYYIYNKFNQKVTDTSAYQWYTVIVLNNLECNYTKDYEKITLDVMDKYYKENKIDFYKFAHWFHYIFIMKDEKNKVMEIIDKNGYSYSCASYSINYPVIICGILLDSQTLCIPSINNGGFGVGQYRLMKSKLLKLLKYNENKLEELKNEKNQNKIYIF